MKYPIIIFSLLLLTAAFPNPTTAAEVVDSICAVVDNDIVLESDISYGINTMLLEQGNRRPTLDQMATMRKQVLDAYITQKILLAQAREETLQVEDRAVDKELTRKLEALVKQVGSEPKLVEYLGRPLNQIKREMRQGVSEGLLIEKLKGVHLTGVYIRRSDVIEFYRQMADSLPRLPERVELSHILLQVEPSTEAVDSARARINAIYEELKAGADFDSIARSKSDDPSSADGGRLGLTQRGDLVPEFEEVAYALEPGEISGIVQTRYGFHIIRLIERQGERISTQHILVKLTPSRDDWERAKLTADTLRQELLAGADFGEMAKQFSDDLESAKKGGKLGQVPVQDLPEGFQTAIAGLDSGQISEPFETEFGVHLVRLDDRLPERGASLTEDWQTIEQIALNYKREKTFGDWVESLKKDHYIWTGEGE